MQNTMRTLLALFIASICAAPMLAANPEFEGIWTIDLERSDGMGPEELKIDNTIELTLDGENINVKRTFKANGQTGEIDWVFVTDGKAHLIPGFRNERNARTKWRKNKLTVGYTMSRQTPRGSFDLDVTEQ